MTHTYVPFPESYFSLLQMATGDSWASAITRSFRSDKDGSVSKGAIAFFSSYVIIVGVVLMNVVVAVLLEEFLNALKYQETDAAIVSKASSHNARPTLEGLMSKFVNFKSPVDLDAHIQEVFEIIDADGTNSISCDAVNEGLQRLNLSPPVHITGENALSLTLRVHNR